MLPLPLPRRAVGSAAERSVHAEAALPPVTAPCGRIRDTPVSATVLTKNSARRLADVLASLAWCDEVVVLDTGSTDDTVEIAGRASNVVVHRLGDPFPGFGRARRRAVALARNDWILSIDSDEILSPELVAELLAAQASPETVYALAFHNYFNDRLITSCGWHPERHERFFNRRVTNFCLSDVHERVQSEGLTVRTLSQPVRHYSYDGIDDFLRKMRDYGQLFAAQHAGRKSSSPGKATRRALWAFAKSYFLQRGCRQGYEGWVISVYKAQTTFWKYLLLHEANGRNLRE